MQTLEPRMCPNCLSHDPDFRYYRDWATYTSKTCTHNWHIQLSPFYEEAYLVLDTMEAFEVFAETF